MTESYSASDLQVLEGLDAVRMRPGMYIGTTSSRGLHHLLWEIVDNAIDEAANGYASLIGVTLHKDGGATVEDDGRGIPVDPHPKLGISGVEVVFTQLHAGGKFSSKNYAYSGGLHGVGASVVNALSKRLVVEVYSRFSCYRQEYASVYDEKQKKIVSGRPMTPLERVGGTRKKGSKVTFWPDERVFEDIAFNHEIVERRLRELAYLNKGVRIVLTDERLEAGARQQEFRFEGGIKDYVRYLNEEKSALHDEVIYLEGQKDEIRFACAFQLTDSYNEYIFSYVNSIPTGEGGSHETGFKAAYTKTLNEYARKVGALKEKDQNLIGEDFREGMTAVITCFVKNPQFEGQTKGRLGNSEVRPAVEGLVSEQLSLYLEDLSHGETAQTLLQKALSAASARQAARKAKDMARQKNSLGAPLVGKLAACAGKNPDENELLIVEGDSAGGSAKQGRDRRFQAILPLRGKPLNAEKKRLDQVLLNEEFRTIITALGTGIGEDFRLDALRYHKIILLADADQDGAHIRAILLTFFYRYMKELVAAGHVYIGTPPLYLVKKGNGEEYVYDDRALPAALKRAGKNYTIQRYKGLGEMNPEQLWETTMNPARRTLVQVTLDDAAQAERMVSVLMGDKVDPRKEYISQYANFNRRDDFEGRVM
ncbi:MAG: type IIA DNA topoisomerase subunit B [Christensenellaceae bacterium]|jgi:DNA gyrase subunit B|nr:type IIA DNA topoisomerase subunit B [Christensenellaceae bacterium]